MSSSKLQQTKNANYALNNTDYSAAENCKGEIINGKYVLRKGTRG